MLVGSAGGGVVAWHADTRRPAAQLPPEPAAPATTALAASQRDPVFLAAAAQARPGAGPPAAAQGGGWGTGRLSCWNLRSFKRVAGYAVPGEAAVVSLALCAQVRHPRDATNPHTPPSRKALGLPPRALPEASLRLPAARAAGQLVRGGQRGGRRAPV
jgi:hypothetical protein